MIPFSGAETDANCDGKFFESENGCAKMKKHKAADGQHNRETSEKGAAV